MSTNTAWLVLCEVRDGMEPSLRQRAPGGGGIAKLSINSLVF